MPSRRTHSARTDCVWPSLGWATSARHLNRKAAQLAREARDVAGGRDVLVFGSIGPLQGPVHGPERPSEARSGEAFREQIEGLLEGGADVLLFETFSDLDELLSGVAEARSLSDLPIVAQMTFGEELLAIDGSSPQTAATALATAGVDAVGVNCGVGPQICIDALVQMGRPSSGLARSIVPNAGLPQRVEGQFIYAAPPAYFGDEVGRFLDAGARIIGGCCGTTPEHIAHMRLALDGLMAPRRRDSSTPTAIPATGSKVHAHPPPSAPRHSHRAAPAHAPRVLLAPNGSSSASRSIRHARAHRAHDRGRAAAPGCGRRCRKYQ